MLWHEQSWPAIQAMDKNLPVILPLGSCEQHGHHLPVFVDSIQVDAIATAVEKKLADRVLMLPTQWLGSSHHHLDFPGTVSLRPSLYSEMIKDMARSVLSAGFKRVFFLNGHGGNQIPGAQALSELVAEDEAANSAMLCFSSWWHVGSEAIKPEKHGMTTHGVSHACEYETSLVLFLRGDLVDMAKVRPTRPVIDDAWLNTERAGRVGLYYRFNRVTSFGNMGSPQNATAEKGKSMFNALIDEIASFLDTYATWPVLPAVGPT